MNMDTFDIKKVSLGDVSRTNQDGKNMVYVQIMYNGEKGFEFELRNIELYIKENHIKNNSGKDTWMQSFKIQQNDEDAAKELEKFYDKFSRGKNSFEGWLYETLKTELPKLCGMRIGSFEKVQNSSQMNRNIKKFEEHQSYCSKFSFCPKLTDDKQQIDSDKQEDHICYFGNPVNFTGGVLNKYITLLVRDEDSSSQKYKKLTEPSVKKFKKLFVNRKVKFDKIVFGVTKVYINLSSKSLGYYCNPKYIEMTVMKKTSKIERYGNIDDIEEGEYGDDRKEDELNENTNSIIDKQEEDEIDKIEKATNHNYKKKDKPIRKKAIIKKEAIIDKIESDEDSSDVSNNSEDDFDEGIQIEKLRTISKKTKSRRKKEYDDDE